MNNVFNTGKITQKTLDTTIQLCNNESKLDQVDVNVFLMWIDGIVADQFINAYALKFIDTPAGSFIKCVHDLLTTTGA